MYQKDVFLGDPIDNAYYATSLYESFEREVALQRVAADAGLAPQVFDNWVCGRHGFLAMAPAAGIELDKALETLTDAEKRAVLVTVSKAIGRLHELGIYHGDLHGASIFIDLNAGNASPTPAQVTIIDFGKSQGGVGGQDGLGGVKAFEQFGQFEEFEFLRLCMHCMLNFKTNKLFCDQMAEGVSSGYQLNEAQYQNEVAAKAAAEAALASTSTSFAT
jgi:serine/threonine protein kinase